MHRRPIVAAALSTALALASPGAHAQLVATQQQKLEASNAPPWDDFGRGVALSGDTLVVASPDRAAYVYEGSGGVWSETALLAPLPAGSGEDYAASVAVSGGTLAVGAPWLDAAGGPADAGGVYVYVHQGGTFVEQALLHAPVPSVYDLFGAAVALSGDTLAVGAPNSNTYVAGRVDVFARVGTSWSHQAALTATGGTGAGEAFGSALALEGDRLIAGDPAWDEFVGFTLFDAGAAWVFERTGTSWAQVARLLRAAGPEPASGFGGAVALSGNKALVGAEFADGTILGANEGKVYSFRRAGGAWTESDVLTEPVPPGGFPYPRFGHSVALAGDRALVGHSHIASEERAYLFERSGSSWVFRTRVWPTPASSPELFGRAVALSDAHAAVGATIGGPGALGAVHVYAVEAPRTYCTAGVSSAGCAAATSANGAPSATAADGFTVGASGVEGGRAGLFLFGANGRQAVPWGNGTSLRCVAPPAQRGGVLAPRGSPGACDGAFAQDLNALWCPTCPGASKNPGAGSVVQAQLWYRDPSSTSNRTTSLSDAVEFAVGP